MTKDKKQIKKVLDLVQKLEKEVPRWVYHIEQIDQQHHKRNKLLMDIYYTSRQEL